MSAAETAASGINGADPTFGGPDVLALRELPDPAPEPGEITIDVTYAAIGLVDALVRRGAFPIFAPPLVLGLNVGALSASEPARFSDAARAVMTLVARDGGSAGRGSTRGRCERHRPGRGRVGLSHEPTPLAKPEELP